MTRKNEDGHGIGLQNVSDIVDKYHGIMKIETENHIFQSESDFISLNLRRAAMQLFFLTFFSCKFLLTFPDFPLNRHFSLLKHRAFYMIKLRSKRREMQMKKSMDKLMKFF